MTMKSLECNNDIEQFAKTLTDDLAKICSDLSNHVVKNLSRQRQVAAESVDEHLQAVKKENAVVATKPDPKIVPVDVFDREIVVGDIVAYAVTEGRSAALRTGTVKAIGKSKYGAPTVKFEVPGRTYVYTDKKDPGKGGHYIDAVKIRSYEPAGRMVIVRA